MLIKNWDSTLSARRVRIIIDYELRAWPIAFAIVDIPVLYRNSEGSIIWGSDNERVGLDKGHAWGCSKDL